ncbi:MAG: ABC transporter substrate-binding protein [Desulfomonilaceae bacterium]
MNRSWLIWLWVLVLVGPVALAQQRTVNLGFITATSGRMATFGAVAKQGAQTAITETNEAGAASGTKFIPFFEDAGKDVKAAENAFRKLVEKDKVDVVMGYVPDAVAPALAAMAERSQIPFFVIGAQSMALTGDQCNRFTFRLSPSSVHNAKTAALLASWTKARTWTTVATDDAGNRELWDLFKKYTSRLKKGTSFAADSSAAFVSAENPDLEAVAKSIIRSKAEGVLISLPGGLFVDFIRKGDATKLFDGKREVVVVNGSLAQLLALGLEMPEGIWWSTPYWYQASWSPANRAFAHNYEAVFGAPPSWEAQSAYAAVKIYAAALQKAKSSDKKAVVGALEGLVADMPVGKTLIRPADHQSVCPTMGGKTARIGVTDRKYRFRSLATMMLFRVKEISDPDVEKGCNMR